MIKVLVVDQFSGVTPIWLQRNPIPFEELVALVQESERKNKPYRPCEVREVEEDFNPPWATTTIRPDADGVAIVWKTKWDSSG